MNTLERCFADGLPKVLKQKGSVMFLNRFTSGKLDDSVVHFSGRKSALKKITEERNQLVVTSGFDAI